jgi:hypothetical protein
MEMTDKNSIYIGDGVYCGFDGFGIWLHANSHDNPTDKIYLEPVVLQQLINFAKRIYKIK